MSRLPSARSKQKALAKALAKKRAQPPAPGAPQTPALAEQRQGLIRALARASPKVSPKASPKASRIA